MNYSENNLVGFYRAIGTLEPVISKTTEQFSIVKALNGFWPQLVYQFYFEINLEENLARLMDEMAEPGRRMAVICNSNDCAKLDQEELHRLSVFPVETWLMMEISELSGEKNQDRQGFEFRKLSKLSEFLEFEVLVNDGLMTKTKIAKGFFAEMARNRQFELYGLFSEDELVCGMVVFTENNISGLYFIVTKEHFRGKGLGEIFICKTLKQLFEKGTERVVLQAVNKAVPLYLRIGFTPGGKIVILMKY